ncbi:hypothetical protein BDF21DRAFT_386322 [Thamnidium elegans]|nr:hypothetical protein BDF21DRAFT_386322 [Thamnidium elegans]
MSCTYVDYLIRPLFENTDENLFLVWSNVKVQDNCAEHPDISGTALVDSKFDYPISVGEVKDEDRNEDTRAVLGDLIKIACFSKEAIDEASFKGTLGIQVVGFQTTFYVTTLLAEGLYTMFEVVPISLPSSLSRMKPFVANIEDILSIKDVYKQCITRNDDVSQLKKQGVNYKRIRQFVKVGKDRKRHCTFVLNH